MAETRRTPGEIGCGVGATGLAALAAVLVLAVPALTRAADTLTGFAPQRVRGERAIEARLQALPTAAAYRRHLEAIASEPHVAGSRANTQVAEYLARTMEAAGLTVERAVYDVLLPRLNPVSTAALVTPVRLPLNNQEYVLPEDPYSANPNLGPGYNAFSGSGDVTAEVVYVNYGRREDFALLRQLGVSLIGKIAVARYGGNYRGYKAKFASEAGAVGLVIYSDPADGGYMAGIPYPEGKTNSASTVQRGSLLTLDYTGDALTPFLPAFTTDDPRPTRRLPIEQVALPKLPVVPLPYGSAIEILQRMRGQAVPGGWQGGLPFAYRVEGGSELTVHLHVEQPLGLTRITDVVGTLAGAEFPDEWIIIGCHYDAWSFGAEDPNGGTAMILSVAEALGQLAKDGLRPRRTIKVAHWDAEECGIIGSTEWVEEHRDELAAKGVAYINADVSVSGPHFGAAGAPTLKGLIIAAAGVVQHPDTALTVYQTWNPPASKAAEPGIGDLGGGSDHLGFYSHLGIPAAALSLSGASLYHSNYDDLAFYARFCDPRFEYGPTMARIDGVVLLRLANADLLPYDLGRYPTDFALHLQALRERTGHDSTALQLTRLDQALGPLREAAAAAVAARDSVLASPVPSPERLRAANRILLGLERSFVLPTGLPGRPWNRSLYMGVNPFNGYDAWPLPGLRHQVETNQLDQVAAWEEHYVKAVTDLTGRLQSLTTELANPASH